MKRLPTVSSTIQSIRNTLMLSQEDLARALGLSVRTIVRWEKEGAEPPPLERERLYLIHGIVEIAQDIMESEDIASWFSRPKEALSGHRPLDILSTFKGIQSVRGFLEKTRWGIF
jgi:putative toxin-antitoxin system antitoxin component (TIGR02293 family)